MFQVLVVCYVTWQQQGGAKHFAVFCRDDATMYNIIAISHRLYVRKQFNK